MSEPRSRIEQLWIDPAEIADAETFKLREPAAVSALAESMVRFGQREPVDIRRTAKGLQLVSGFRRLAAARMLKRDRLKARVHDDLSDQNALFLALADDLDRRPWTAADRASLAGRLKRFGRLPGKVEALIRLMDSQAPPEGGAGPNIDDCTVDATVRAAALRDKMADVCNDLAVLYEEWDVIESERRAALKECVRYMRDMYPFLEGDGEETT